MIAGAEADPASREEGQRDRDRGEILHPLSESVLCGRRGAGVSSLGMSLMGQNDIILTSCASIRRPSDVGLTHMMSI